MTPSKFRRSRKLIQPGLQLRLIGSFVGLAAIALLGQFLLLGYRLTSAASNMEGSGGELAAEVPRVMLEGLTFSLIVLLPVTFAFGILLTFRIAGPIYNFERFLKSVSRGEQLTPCKIRDGDELQNLCDAINEATEPLRQNGPQPISVNTITEETEPLRAAG
jgi:methyl-accepting chemotaxis protein